MKHPKGKTELYRERDYTEIECVIKATALIVSMEDVDTFDEQCDCIIALNKLKRKLQKGSDQK